MQTPKLVYTTYIRSTPQQVWDAITKPEFTRQYWGGLANISDWTKGATWRHMTSGDQPEAWVVGTVLEVDSPKRLVLSWADPDDLADQSRVTFEIEMVKDSVRLIVTHDEFKPGSPMAAKVDGGWPRVLSSLKSYLETGKGLAAGNCG